MAKDSTIGTVYLVHLDRAFGHARHYLGWALDVDARMAEHRAGRGSKLLAAVARAGIGWRVARTWPGVDRNFERKLKRQRQACVHCPLCNAERMQRKMAHQTRRRQAVRALSQERAERFANAAESSATRMRLPTHCARCEQQMHGLERSRLGLWNGKFGALCDKCDSQLGRSFPVKKGRA